MKKYKAHLDQGGGGCDYTIGCGHTLIWLKATNMEEAKTELQKIIEEEYSHEERSLDSATIYEISDEFDLEVKGFYDELEKKRRQQSLLDNEKRERAELERLKQKYNN